MRFFKFISFLLACRLLDEVLSLSCVDHSNKTVDWYVLYKLPHIKKNKDNKLIQSGYAYTYITANSETGWKLSSISIGDPKSILALTLQPLYQGHQSKLLYILYNDQPPSQSPRPKKGHTKGVVLADANGGLWLIHSVPLFPPLPEDGFTFPNTGAIYGQSFLCISLSGDNLNNVGLQLQYNQPQMYDRNIPYGLIASMPHLNDVINRVQIKDPPWYNELNLTSINGTEFVSFAKTKDFGKELYEDWIAPSLSVSLFVETWLNGDGRLSSNCSRPFSVKNVLSITMKSADVTFKSTIDHSKWSLSTDNNTYWVCIGDINREEHQKHRGGGTVCLDNKLVATSYMECVTEIENCPQKSPHRK